MPGHCEQVVAQELTGLLVGVAGVQLGGAQAGRTGRRDPPGVAKQVRRALNHAGRRPAREQGLRLDRRQLRSFEETFR